MEKATTPAPHQVAYDQLVATLQDHEVKFGAGQATLVSRTRIAVLLDVITCIAPKRLRRRYAKAFSSLASTGTADMLVRGDLNGFEAVLLSKK